MESTANERLVNNFEYTQEKAMYITSTFSATALISYNSNKKYAAERKL